MLDFIWEFYYLLVIQSQETIPELRGKGILLFWFVLAWFGTTLKAQEEMAIGKQGQNLRLLRDVRAPERDFGRPMLSPLLQGSVTAASYLASLCCCSKFESLTGFERNTEKEKSTGSLCNQNL